jgi:Cu2+-exporting ATPase
MSRSFVFYIHHAFGHCCQTAVGNVLKNAYPSKLKLFDLDLTTPDPKKLVIELDGDGRKEQIIWDEIRQILDDAGHPCEHYDYNPTKKRKIRVRFITRFKKAMSSPWIFGSIGCLSGLALLISSFVMGALSFSIMLPIACISTYLTLLLGGRSILSATKKLFKSGALTMDTLFAISTVTVLVVSFASLFVPWLPMMFEVGLFIYGFKQLGNAIEDRLKQKLNSAQFQDRAPKHVQKLTENGVEEYELERIGPGDKVILSSGSIVPVDGVCEEDCLLYNTIITGANLPRRYRKGEHILAGMRVAPQSPDLKIRVTQSSKRSYLARLDSGIAQSLLEKAPIQVKTGTILTYFIPSVLLFALLSFMSIALFMPFVLAIKFTLSILALACPCTLGLIVPLAVKTGMRKAAEHGVQFKNPKILQQAAQIDTVLLDLHGTLTTGIPSIKSCTVLENTGLSEQQFFDITQALEAKSMHPIGKAIHTFSKEKKAQTLHAQLFQPRHHAGEIAKIGDAQYSIGSLGLMREQGINTEAVDEQVQLASGDSLVYVARNQAVIGYFVITEELRKDALHAVQALRAKGLHVHLCTGADEQTAKRYAKALNLETIHANCVATSIKSSDRSKPAYIKALQKKGHKVAMAGDGPNDGPALVACDFGIAVASQNGDDLTQHKAGAVIQSGSLLPIVSAFAISKQTVRNIKQNLILSLVYNASSVLVSGALLFGLGMALNPALCAALMVIQACTVLLNVFRFKKQSLPHLKNKTTEEPLQFKNSSHQRMDQNLPRYSLYPRSVNSANEPKYEKESYLPLWRVFPPVGEKTKSYIEKSLTQ